METKVTKVRGRSESEAWTCNCQGDNVSVMPLEGVAEVLFEFSLMISKVADAFKTEAGIIDRKVN